MTKHTPGPWVYDPDTTHPETGRALIISPKDYICEIWDCTEGDGVEIQTPEEQIANATLIAAAPEMLEALEGLVADWERVHGPMPADHEARAAIKKARGEE